jgi:hypothetical protein
MGEARPSSEIAGDEDLKPPGSRDIVVHLKVKNLRSRGLFSICVIASALLPVRLKLKIVFSIQTLGVDDLIRSRVLVHHHSFFSINFRFTQHHINNFISF